MNHYSSNSVPQVYWTVSNSRSNASDDFWDTQIVNIVRSYQLKANALIMFYVDNTLKWTYFQLWSMGKGEQHTANLQRMPACMLVFEINPSLCATAKNVPWLIRD